MLFSTPHYPNLSRQDLHLGISAHRSPSQSASFLIVVVGAKGGVGEAFVDLLSQLYPQAFILETSRDQKWVDQKRESRQKVDLTQEHDFTSLAQRIDQIQKEQGCSLQVVINCAGLLHQSQPQPQSSSSLSSLAVQPERSLKMLNLTMMRSVFEINTFGVALLLKTLSPFFPKNQKGIFASLSARVGSIGDNRLGGWYSYRSSKAAHNMMIKTASLELKRTRPHLLCVSLHPGTVKTPLSDPFTQRREPKSLFTPQESALYLCRVLNHLEQNESGNFFAWDGQKIEW